MQPIDSQLEVREGAPSRAVAHADVAAPDPEKGYAASLIRANLLEEDVDPTPPKEEEGEGA